MIGYTDQAGPMGGRLFLCNPCKGETLHLFIVCSSQTGVYGNIMLKHGK
ncbi:hypothetical protein HMPREF9374_1482 [Desmospora sp. 8437]|nr:hypothetical protein HMPREF9374_1482 [Desmospora sp. 8437]